MVHLAFDLLVGISAKRAKAKGKVVLGFEPRFPVF